MLLSHKTKINVTKEQSNIIGHMCYAASKLWNVCNYERNNYKSLSLERFPDWYYQKKVHKDNIWYKQLPSQTAQEVCKLLDKSWKSYFTLKKTKGIENPHSPRFKQDNIPITYMQNGIIHKGGDEIIRLSISKNLKSFMSEEYNINVNFLYLKNKLFKNIDNIKQIKIYPPENQKCEIIIIYEVPDAKAKPDNGRYLSIDLGVHNMMTCFSLHNKETFIVGREYQSIARYFNKEIARVQSQWASTQSRKGIKYPKLSKHTLSLYEKRSNSLSDYLHKITKAIVDYCVNNGINTVIVGDLTGVRENKDYGDVVNQQFHSLPYARIYLMLEYKLKLQGITFVKQEESYTSQCSPKVPEVSSKYRDKGKRVHRGLYISDKNAWNADAVGAFNILRKYLSSQEKTLKFSNGMIKSPYILKVAV